MTARGGVEFCRPWQPGAGPTLAGATLAGVTLAGAPGWGNPGGKLAIPGLGLGFIGFWALGLGFRVRAVSRVAAFV